MTITKRRQLTGFIDQTNIYNHLRNCTELVKSDASGISYVRYRGDWDDQKVGEKFGYSASQIKDFRREHIGNENPGSPGKPHNRMAMLKRLEALEGRVELLENVIEDAFGATLNRLLDKAQARRQQKSANGLIDGPQPF